jgi:hypothetical protein
MLKSGKTSHHGVSLRCSQQTVAQRGLRGVAMICVVVSLALALGACSKCDVPNWSAPRACHDGPAPQ